MPTVNPPGENYEDCARASSAARWPRAASTSSTTRRTAAPSTPRPHPRVNVVGTRAARRAHPLVHLNGHFDVVPRRRRVDASIRSAAWCATDASTGAASCDMKAGIAAAVFAAEAIRRAGVDARRQRRDQRHRRRRERRLRRRGVAGASGTDQRRPHRLRHHPGAARTSIASASAIAASTGSRSRRAAGSRTAACRSSASAPSTHMGARARAMRDELGPALAARATADAGRARAARARHAQHQRHRRRPAGATASRRRASRIAAAPSSIAAS